MRKWWLNLVLLAAVVGLVVAGLPVPRVVAAAFV